MSSVIFGVDERGVASIELNRPSAGNALDLEVADGLAQAITSIRENADVRVIRLSSTGKIFCAGGDVRAMAAASDRPRFLADLAGSIHRSLIALDELPVPIVAAIQGPVAGAGLGLLLAADYVAATPASSYVAAYSTIGLSPDCGVSIGLPRVIGMRRALQMLVLNERIDASTALAWGLVDTVVELDELASDVDGVVSLLLDRQTSAVGQARRLVRASYQRDFAEHLDDEALTITRLGGTEEVGALLSSRSK
ncbi:enoyl-CoA hydratase/isomerase family protein [Gordonia amicalis]|uniref:Enoyl-CoA hydratase-related protein n=1 Tax=Gordonia amicalis TaxID=89053 RepID=A0AAE4R3G5_9ACTN|nr:enoyl-CoA hydratase-related protein [Gordonia amicalis]MCZ4578553.1 enoyl-CoA hydratase-related protein [Gordonia amicalis]MCZ4651645.1 enoyl-CoA hydratase-related protein [Gordonia amicalis]MDJ0455103.1 enoyl-CoA hydratase-related protein [Gordonia amicalis]MDV6307748.1 enoyl-CoA hydratase-related protein [Gordonia amicalis]MDV6311392.1 enoyl-CoA hydratase-related protein [Gordonia amicalis]